MASNTQVQTVPLAGGLNTTTSEQMLALGECLELINYEITTNGRYQRVKGYERFDGQPAPSTIIASDLPGQPFSDSEAGIAAVRAAQLLRRDQIMPVPGIGRVLGVFGFKGVVYAFRNVETGDAAKMYKATETGWEEVVTPALLPNGKYEVRETNFTGSTGTKEIVGVDGVNPAFRFDGTTFTQIASIIAPDAPTHLDILPSQILVLSFRGGSLLYSSVGDPTKFSSVDGGGEIAVGHEISGIEVQADATTAIFARNKSFVLYGSSPSDFQLKSLALRSGALERTIQSIGTSIYLDDRGLTRLDRVQEFGDFESATISQKIQPLLTERLQQVRTSMVLREKNQYRLFFSDQRVITMTMYGNDVLGYTQLHLKFTANCAWSGEDETGQELYFMGGDDGYVYQMESGNSFDGEAYGSFIHTGFMDFGAPEHKKKWRKAVIESQYVSKLDLLFKCHFDYKDPDIPLSETFENVQIGNGSKWDLADWNINYWGGASTTFTDIYLDGVSRNIAFSLYSESDYFPPHILSLIHLHLSPRGRRR